MTQKYSPWHLGLLLLFHNFVAINLSISGVTLLGLPRLKVQLGGGAWSLSGKLVKVWAPVAKLFCLQQPAAQRPGCLLAVLPQGEYPEHVCVCCFWGGGRCIQTWWWSLGSLEQAGREEEAWVHPRALLLHSTLSSVGGEIWRDLSQHLFLSMILKCDAFLK